jgi:hypothetical protein
LHFYPTWLLKWIVKNRSSHPEWRLVRLFDGLNISKEYDYINAAAESDLKLLKERVREFALSTPPGLDRRKFIHCWGFKFEDTDSSGQMNGEISPEHSKIYLEDLKRAHNAIAEEHSTVTRQMNLGEPPLEEGRVLDLLVKDLLSENEMKCYEWHQVREQSLVGSQHPKYIGVQLLGIFGVLCYVWFAVVFIFYFAYTRVEELQILWYYSLLTWWLIDFFVFRPVTILAANVFMPSLISSKIYSISNLIVRCISDLDMFSIDPSKFKWSLMLFSSARVAAKFYDSRIGELLFSISLNSPRQSPTMKAYPCHALAMLNVDYNDGYMTGLDKRIDKEPFYMPIVSILAWNAVIGDIIVEGFVISILSAAILGHFVLFTTFGLIGLAPSIAVFGLLLLLITAVRLKLTQGVSGRIGVVNDDMSRDDESHNFSNSSSDDDDAIRKDKDKGMSSVSQDIDYGEEDLAQSSVMQMVRKFSTLHSNVEERRNSRRGSSFEDRRNSRIKVKPDDEEEIAPVDRRVSEIFNWVDNVLESKDDDDDGSTHFGSPDKEKKRTKLVKQLSAGNDPNLYRSTKTKMKLSSLNAPDTTGVLAPFASPKDSARKFSVRSTIGMIDDALSLKPPTRSQWRIKSSKIGAQKSVDSVDSDLFDLTRDKQQSSFESAPDDGPVDMEFLKRLSLLDDVMDELDKRRQKKRKSRSPTRTSSLGNKKVNQARSLAAAEQVSRGLKSLVLGDSLHESEEKAVEKGSADGTNKTQHLGGTIFANSIADDALPDLSQQSVSQWRSSNFTALPISALLQQVEELDDDSFVSEQGSFVYAPTPHEPSS